MGVDPHDPSEATHPSRASGVRPERAGDRGPPEHVRLGRFAVLDRLGEGGMGVVFMAYDDQLDRRVALKLIHAFSQDDRARVRLTREAQALARLSHPNVVQVYETGVHRDAVFIAMEHIPGRTLREWILADEDRSWRATLAVMLQAGRGLEAAHLAGLVHRDFKPENAILGDDGRVRVLDFGLVRAHDDAVDHALIGSDDPTRSAELDSLDTESTLNTRADATTGAPVQPIATDRALEQSLTRTGAIMGTPAYMAPEQHLGRPCDAHADQFAFCVSVYEALFGARPFTGKTHDELRRAVLSGALASPPSSRPVPPSIYDAIVRGLANTPARRWPNMSTLLSALERGLSSGDERRGWTRLAVGSLVGAALLGVALLGVARFGASPATPEQQSAPTAALTDFDLTRDFRSVQQGQGGWHYLYDRDRTGRYDELEIGLNYWGDRSWIDVSCTAATFTTRFSRPDAVLATATYVDNCRGWTTLAWEAPEPGEFVISFVAEEFNHCESQGMDLEIRAADGELLWSKLDTDPEVQYQFQDTRSFAKGERIFFRLAHGPGRDWCDAMALIVRVTRT